MAIRPRGNVFQIDVTYKGRRAYDTAETHDLARVKEGQLLDRLHRESLDGKKEGWTLKEAVETTFERCWKGTRSEQKNNQVAGYLVEHFGAETPLEDIREAKIDEYKDVLKEKGNSAATINRRLAVLSRIFTFAKSRHGLETIPTIDLEPIGKGRIRVVTRNEEAVMLKILQQWGKPEASNMVQVLLDTGMRPSEPFTLKKEDLNLDGDVGVITIWDNKTDKPRTVPLTKRCQAIFEKQSKSKFSTLFDKTNDSLDWVWKRLRKHMRLDRDKGFVPYCLRHTCATRLIQAGVNVVVVKEWLGHEDLETTMNYVHLNPQDLIAQIGALEPRQAASGK
jgi:integrase